jgi:hypothetical protein
MAEPAPTEPTPHGFAQEIGEALSEVTLNPDQEADVEALGAMVEPREIEVDRAEAALLQALSNQVKAQAINKSALEPEIAAYVAARAQIAEPIRHALEGLHELLDADQRADFADALECGVHDVTREYLSGEKLEAFATKLGLDEQQRQEVRDDFQDLMPMLQHERRTVHAAIEAFRGDSFSLERYFPLEQVAAKARARAERIVDVTDSIMSVLKPDQIAKLAMAIGDAARAKEEKNPGSAPGEEKKGQENVGTAKQPWRAGFVRGGWYGRWARPFPVGGARFFYGHRVGAFPVAAGWGWGW